MRGKEGGAAVMGPSERITPAHAGKSRPTPETAKSSRDHPRTCGEKFLEVVQPLGITPAHAGKSNVIDEKRRKV